MPTRKRDPASKRNFIAKFTDAPLPAAVDTAIPQMGQRKRPAKRRRTLAAPQIKAD